MRTLDTPVKQIRRKIFTEVAKLGFESTDDTLIHDIESIPYNIVQERAQYRESIYRERAVASERVRLAMGLSLRPENKAVHLTDEWKLPILMRNIMNRRLCRLSHLPVLPVLLICMR